MCITEFSDTGSDIGIKFILHNPVFNNGLSSTFNHRTTRTFSTNKIRQLKNCDLIA